MNKSLYLVVLCLIALLIAAAPVWSRGGEEPEPEPEAAAEKPALEKSKFGEAPMLADLVAKGELPPIEERLPKNPKVVEMIEGIGRYGGDLIAFATTENIFSQDLQGMFGSSFFRNPRNSIGVEPDLAEGYEVNEDNTAVTIFLREGLKWSDGHPLTSEDVRFTFDDMHFNTDVQTWGSFGIDAVEVIDEYTVKLINYEGLGTNILGMSAWYGGYATSYHPAHYLKKWHGDYNPDAEKIAQEEGFDHWYGNVGCMRSHYWWAPLTDIEKPQVEPWQLEELSHTAKLYERNPYFWRVDPEGNQLPYIDRLRIQIVNGEVYQLKVTGGDASIAYYQTQFDNLPLYKSSEQSGDYRVILHPGVSSSVVKLGINMYGRHPDPFTNSILSNLKFRQALSVAINRDEINEVVYQGLGVPGKVAPISATSFYQKGWREDYAQYDPALANKLLDEIGLDEKDSGGFRQRPDGKTFTFIIDYTTAPFTTTLELVSEYLEDVGIKTLIKLADPGLLEQRVNAGDFHCTVHPEPDQPWSSERKMFQLTWVWGSGPFHWNSWLSTHNDAMVETLPEGTPLPTDWRWRTSGKEDTYEDIFLGDVPPKEPPDYWKAQQDLVNEWNQTEMGSSEYMELGTKVFDFYVKEIPSIGTVGEVPFIMIAKNKLRNVVPPGWLSGVPIDHEYVQTWMDQMYWE